MIHQLTKVVSNHSFRLRLPGYSLSLNYRSGFFPSGLDYRDIKDDYIGHTCTYREILMMQAMNAITDKLDWDQKVFNDDITAKWREEFSQLGVDITPKMMDWIIKELQWKANLFQKNGLALQNAVVPFESVLDEHKDYHPGSDKKVVDLVHPSLFPVIYGRTRILPDRVINLDDCIASIGEGEVLQVPSEGAFKLDLDDSAVYEAGYRDAAKLKPFSRKFQWLPCDVKFTGDDSGCHIMSYINNAHPTKHRSLYEAVQRIIAHTIPLWNITLAASVYDRGPTRIPYKKVEYLPHPEPEPVPLPGEDPESDEFYERYAAWQSTQPIILPEPGNFTPPELRSWDEVDLQKEFREEGLQVIVKLANIELSPKKPDYDGGSWHIEGQLNERICATANYYYDSMNITESTLGFRQRACTYYMDDVDYEQDRHEFLSKVFGFGSQNQDDSHITQDLGSVVCREGRLLTFPNILQHRVSSFSLADRSKSGHRKILGLFLVDPHRRIISSANIPPQQEDWAKEKKEVINKLLSQQFPPELKNMAGQNIPDSSITMDEAMEYRLELMEERSANANGQNQVFQIGNFSLCAH